MRKRKKRRHLKKRFVFTIGILVLLVFIITQVKATFLSDSTPSAKKSLSEIVVVLDPGHGGFDPGSEGMGYSEKDITLEVANLVGSYLEKENIQIHYTREKDIALGDDESSDLKKRVDIANKVNPDYMISIHLNASSGTKRSYGFEIWKQNQSSSLANHVVNSLATLNYTIERDTKNGEKSLYVLKKQKAETILVELGFIDDSQDMNYIGSAKGKESIANAIAKGIIEEAKGKIKNAKD